MQAVCHDCLQDANALDPERVHIGIGCAEAWPDAKDLHVSPVPRGLGAHLHMRSHTAAVDEANPVVRPGWGVLVMDEVGDAYRGGRVPERGVGSDR